MWNITGKERERRSVGERDTPRRGREEVVDRKAHMQKVIFRFGVVGQMWVRTKGKEWVLCLGNKTKQ